MTNSSPIKGLTTKEKLVATSILEAEPTIVTTSDFTHGELVINFGSTEGSGAGAWERALRQTLPIFRNAPVVGINVPEKDTDDQRFIGEDQAATNGEGLLMAVGGGDGTVNRAAIRAGKIGATLMIGGYGNGNNAALMYNGRKHCRNPEKMLQEGLAVVRTVRLMEMLIAYEQDSQMIEESHLALTSMGYGAVAAEADGLEAARVTYSHRIQWLRKIREYRQAAKSARAILNGGVSYRIQPIDSNGKEIHSGPEEGPDTYPHKLIVTHDWCRGFMTKYVYLPRERWSDHQAHRLDLERPELLHEWIHGIQTATHPTTPLSGQPEHIITLDPMCGYVDGEPFQIPAGSKVTVRMSDMTVNILARNKVDLYPPKIPIRAHLAGLMARMPTPEQAQFYLKAFLNPRLKH